MLAQAARLGMLEHDFPEHRLSRSGAIPVIGNWESNFPFGSFCAVAKRQLREVLRGDWNGSMPQNHATNIEQLDRAITLQ